MQAIADGLAFLAGYRDLDAQLVLPLPHEVLGFVLARLRVAAKEKVHARQCSGIARVGEKLLGAREIVRQAWRGAPSQRLENLRRDVGRAGLLSHSRDVLDDRFLV